MHLILYNIVYFSIKTPILKYKLIAKLIKYEISNSNR